MTDHGMGQLSRRRMLLLSVACWLVGMLPGALHAQDDSISKYDDASWHEEGDFPDDAPEDAGATHIAMFVAWAVLNDLAGPLHSEELGDDLRQLKERTITPGKWLMAARDGKFTPEDLNAEGNRFARAYYGDPDGKYTAPKSYIEDYGEAFVTSKTIYHVPDSWETYAKIEPVISARFRAWKSAR